MILYEVNLEIHTDIFDSYMEWLTPHIKEMLMFKGFEKAELYENSETSNKEVTCITASYYVDNEQNLQHYLDEMSQKMREDGLKRFSGQFTATRRVLKQISSYSK